MPTALSPLPGIASQDSEANAINNRGEIVGKIMNNDAQFGEAFPVIWDRDGTLTVLPLGDPFCEFDGGLAAGIINASGINARGIAVGQCLIPQGDPPERRGTVWR